MAKGKFITFEGGEGAGKSTQTRALAQKLRKAGLHVLETREPGGTAGAELIRRLVKDGAIEALGPFAEAIVLAAARDDHLTQIIRPALDAGTWVICDRFSDSTRAYQGAGGGVDADILARLEELTVGETRPDLTLILDAPPKIALARVEERSRSARNSNVAVDRFEKESVAFHQNLRDAFLAIAKAEPDRCIVIDATASPAEVTKRIWEAVSQRFAVKA